jgi:hypothetical protein
VYALNQGEFRGMMLRPSGIGGGSVCEFVALTRGGCDSGVDGSRKGSDIERINRSLVLLNP